MFRGERVQKRPFARVVKINDAGHGFPFLDGDLDPMAILATAVTHAGVGLEIGGPGLSRLRSASAAALPDRNRSGAILRTYPRKARVMSSAAFVPLSHAPATVTACSPGEASPANQSLSSSGAA